MKLLIITGGSRGLGEQICSLAEKDGWKICEFSRSGARPGSYRFDLGSPDSESLHEIMKSLASEQYDEVRVILNAGTVAPVSLIKNLTMEEISAGVSVTAGTIFFAGAVLSAFADHNCRKSIVQISSGAALHGRAGWSVYCLSKAGLDNFIRAAADEQSGEKFPFETAIFDPGVMDTEMQSAIRGSLPEQFPSVDRFKELKTSGLLKDPREIAEILWNRLDDPFSPAERVSASELQKKR